MATKLNEAAAPYPVAQEVFLTDVQRHVGHFILNPYRQLGDSDSGHNVMFGTFPPYGEVAIKPFPTMGRAYHEKEVLEHVSSKGFATLEPLDIATEGVYTYLLSRYVPGLRHFGQLNWHETIASRRLKNELTPAVNLAGDFVGQLHAKGITHGDLQAKNFMILDSGQPFVADMERGQIRLKGSELNRKANVDLATFGTSILRHGLLEDRSLRYRLKYMADELIEPAHEAAGMKASEEATTNVLTLIATSIAGDNHSRKPTTERLKKKVKHLHLR